MRDKKAEDLFVAINNLGGAVQNLKTSLSVTLEVAERRLTSIADEVDLIIQRGGGNVEQLYKKND